MRMIDPHLHTDRMKGKDVELISIAGVEGAVLPTPHLMPWGLTSDTLIRMWDNFVNFQVCHSASMCIQLKVTLGVPFYGMTKQDQDICLKKLPEYLEHENVVGLGEIGMDAGIPAEEELFRTHLNIAKERGLPVIVHCPTPLEPQGPAVVDKIISVLRDEKFPVDKAVLDHTGRNTLEAKLKSGCYVGLSLCYDKLRPEDAAEIVRDYPDYRDQLLINSEFGWTADGYYSVPRAVLAMRRLGLKREEIEHVTWDNPSRLFGFHI